MLEISSHTIFTGVQLPINKEVYEPILDELEDFGVVFSETEMPYIGYNPDKLSFTSGTQS